jgi:TRAP-type C4-dicarboxylate transport system permease small subunit
MLPARQREALAAAGCVLGVAFFAVVVYGGLDPLAHAWSSGEYEGEGALRIPTWPARFIVLLGSGLAAADYALLFLSHLNSVLKGKA